MRASLPEGFVPRETCPDCRRPAAVCYCRHVTQIPTRTRVVVLQHPRERDVAINTARIAALCLPRAETHVGSRFDVTMLRKVLEADPDRPPVLLYPGPDAIDVGQAPPDRAVSLVVLDGTWWQAKKLLQLNPLLASLPRYAFTPPAPSDYRIRREPREDYVSTLEALAHVLGLLEGDLARFTPMLTPFRAMVDTQIEHATDEDRQPRARLRARVPQTPRDRLPEVLKSTAARGRLVCVHAEANAWPYNSPERATGEELVHLAAERIASGETLELVHRPEVIAPHTATCLEIAPERIEAGASREELGAAWRAFLRPDDVVCTWGPQAVRLLESIASDAASAVEIVDVRHAARSYLRGRAGLMTEFAASIEAVPEPPRLSGRAGRRLSELAAIVRAFAREPA